MVCRYYHPWQVWSVWCTGTMCTRKMSYLLYYLSGLLNYLFYGTCIYRELIFYDASWIRLSVTCRIKIYMGCFLVHGCVYIVSSIFFTISYTPSSPSTHTHLNPYYMAKSWVSVRYENEQISVSIEVPPSFRCSGYSSKKSQVPDLMKRSLRWGRFWVMLYKVGLSNPKHRQDIA